MKVGKKIGILGILGLLTALSVMKAEAQEKKAPEPPPTIASALDKELSVVEKDVVSAAEAMPEEKYGFAPTNGEYKGVRTFGEEVRHIAAANHMFFGLFYGEKADMETAEKGPAGVTTKAQIVQYLKESFAKGHKAIATITAENVVTVLGNAPFSLLNTRLAIASWACTHSFDHYGQIVEYLRMNGIVPPASRQ
jgi:uncharacterized damage-inducible protein DinB